MLDLFKGNKELKLVLPCLKEKNTNDNVIKELLAYKLFEVVSPYHFKTRLLDFTLSEQKGKKVNYWVDHSSKHNSTLVWFNFIFDHNFSK